MNDNQVLSLTAQLHIFNLIDHLQALAQSRREFFEQFTLFQEAAGDISATLDLDIPSLRQQQITLFLEQVDSLREPAIRLNQCSLNALRALRLLITHLGQPLPDNLSGNLHFISNHLSLPAAKDHAQLLTLNEICLFLPTLASLPGDDTLACFKTILNYLYDSLGRIDFQEDIYHSCINYLSSLLPSID